MNTTNTVTATGTVAINPAVDVNHFRPYDSALPVPDIKGYRTVKIIYRTNAKTGTKGGETSFIRVPDHITEQAVQDRMVDFLPFVIGYLQSQEDEIVKQMHKEGAAEIQEGKLTLDLLLEHMQTSQTAARLNAERIGEWFKDNMADMLAVAFAEKMGLSDEPSEAELQKLSAIIGTYDKKLQSLASPKTAYRKEEAELLQRALEVTGAKDTVIGTRFYARLEQMKTATPDDLLMAL